jgi:hypothetical protein
VTGEAKGSINGSATLRIAGSLRGVGRKSRDPRSHGTGPRPDAAYERIDLFIGKQSTGALREGGHRRPWHSVCGSPANRCIVGNRKEHGIGKGDRRSALAPRAVTPRAVLRIEDGEVNDLIGWDNLGTCPGSAGRTAARTTGEEHDGQTQK